MINEKKLAEMRAFAEKLKIHPDTTKNAFIFADLFDQTADTLSLALAVVRAAEMLFSEFDRSDTERAERIHAFIRPLHDALAPFRAEEK